MTARTLSKLDTAKFRKVHSLMTGGSTAGERSAARARAEVMAAKAGMTLKDAVSSLDAKPAAPKPANIFDGFDDWCEAREPGYKAREASKKAEARRKREAARIEILKEYGSEEAVWAETERERRLRETLEPLADWGTYANIGASPGARYIKGYAGWTCGRPTALLFEALMRAFPFPIDTVGLWQEYREWERLYEFRSAFTENGACDNPEHVRARIAALEFNLDTLSDWTFEGFAARLEWLKFRTEKDLSRDIHEDLSMIDTIRLDFGVLHQMHLAQGGRDPLSRSPPVQTGYRTTAEKRAAVLSMLSAHPELPTARLPGASASVRRP